MALDLNEDSNTSLMALICKMWSFILSKLVSAGEDVLVFYNERASFNMFIEMMKADRNRMDFDESSPLRYL